MHNPELKVYANDVRFSNAQLVQIRYGIENRVDVSVYSNPDIPTHIMEQIRIYLQHDKWFTVRYTLDDGKTIQEADYFAVTKQGAVNAFIAEHEDGDIVDVRYRDGV